MNPYNCTRPGNLFVGYDDVRRELAQDLRDGKSFALLGGRRCGKTSFLLQLQKDLSCAASESYHPLPCFIDIQGLGECSPALLFKAIYNGLNLPAEAEQWNAPPAGGEYEHFLQLLDKAERQLTKKHGPYWVAILLVDELDAAVTKLPNDQFFQNLRNLLMVSRFNGRFRMIASGVKEMARLISSGSSPLNNLCHVYLRDLHKEEIDSLIKSGFPEGFSPAANDVLIGLTGGHPYLLQGLLDKLRKRSLPLDGRSVDLAASDWLREHKDFRRWFEGFGPAERAVYRLLAAAPNGALAREPLRQRLPRELQSEHEDALTVLAYHGLIDDSDPDNPAISGTMFRDWFLQNVPSEPAPETKDLLLSLFENSGEQAESDTPLKGVDSSSTAVERLPRIPDHEVVSLQPIGSGSFGTVWLAKTLMGTYRAIKVVARSSFAEQRPFDTEFNGIRKYEPISRTHPGLVQILQVGSNQHEGYFYYVMEVADDEQRGQQIDPSNYSPKNLGRALAQRGKLPLREAVRVGVALAEALAHLHKHKLIHRDLKPSNIIFIQNTPKLADIGLVTDMRSTAGNGTWIGTEGYIPPEGPGTAAADVYSFGKVLYELSTGLDRRRFPSLPTLAAEEHDVHGLRILNEVILRACEENPHARYPSAIELCEDLHRLGRSLALPAEAGAGQPLWQRLWRKIRK